jgi:hypothetical protein
MDFVVSLVMCCVIIPCYFFLRDPEIVDIVKNTPTTCRLDEWLERIVRYFNPDKWQ